VSSPPLNPVFFRRGFRHQTIQEALPLNSGVRTLVGTTFALRNVPARQEPHLLSLIEDPRHTQRCAIEAGPTGTLKVTDSTGAPLAATEGSFLITRLMVRDNAASAPDDGFHDSQEVALEAVDITVFEDFVTQEIQDGRSVIGLYPAADPTAKADFEALRTKENREYV